MNAVKSSYFFMGTGQIIYKQYTKGILYVLAEIGYIAYMILFGFRSLANLVTLGTVSQSSVYDKNLGFNVTVDGDNSMLCLIYGVMTVLVTVLFILAYRTSIKSAKEAKMQYRMYGRANSIIQDVISLGDKNFHRLMMALPLLGILLFTVLPLVFMILIAFTNYDKSHQPPGNLFDWVGLANFKNMLFGNGMLSGTFFPVLVWTLVWAVLATASCYVFGIITALLINKKGIKFKSFWRTILILTIAVPQFISLLIMRNMLNKFGPINATLQSLGVITSPLPFLTDPTWARATVLIVNLWVGIPYTMLMTSGILMNIPDDLYEAARIDGAGPVKMFFKITLPHVWHVTAPFVITQFIGNINNFNVIYLLTGGEPLASDYYVAGKTDLLVTWLYKLTADEKDYNLASTIGIIVFVISIILSLIAYRNTSSYKDEERFG